MWSLSTSPRLYAIIIFYILWASTVFAVTNFTWIYPELNSNPSYNYKDSILVSWESNFPNPYLTQYCWWNIQDSLNYTVCFNSTVDAVGDSLNSLDNSASSSNQPFTGDSSCGPNVTCAFAIWDPDDPSKFNSEGTYWTITQDEKARATTYSASTITSLQVSTTQRPSPITITKFLYATPSPNTTTNATRTSSQSSSAPTFAPSPNGPSQGAAAGIGIGAAAAVVTVVIAAFLLFRRRRQKLQQKRDSTPGLTDVKAPQDFDPESQALEEVQQPAVGELGIDPPTLPPRELDASPITLEIGSPKSPVEDAGEVGEPDVSVNKERLVVGPDATEDEEIRIGESIRTRDE